MVVEPVRRRLRRLPVKDQHVLLALGLTLATGVIDAVSYFSLDRVFTANMTGNMALLGIGVATSLHTVEGNIYAFVGFLVGSVVVGHFLRTRTGPVLKTASHALAIQLLLLVVLTMIVALVNVHIHDGWRFAVCAFLAAAMGIQTGVARHLAVQDVNTTVATMTLHDLAAASRIAGGDSVRWRRRRRGGVVAALFAGAAFGTALSQLVSWGGLALGSVIVAAVLAVTVLIAGDDQGLAAAGARSGAHARDATPVAPAGA